MKALRNILIIIATFAMILSTANAQRSKTSNAQIKQKLEQNIIKSDNGDITLNVKVSATKELISSTKDIPTPLLVLLLYVDPQMDFEKFNKIMIKELAGKRFVEDILKATDKYLSTNNMQLKPMKFSPNNARLKLEQGLPLFISLQASNDYDKIAKRTQARAKTSDMATWKKSLIKQQIKSFNLQKLTITFGLVQGYNKQTNEFLVMVHGKPHWFTESELKKVTAGCHELRI